MRAPRRTTIAGFAMPMVLALVGAIGLFGVLTACSGSDEQSEADDSDAAYERYMRQVCLASGHLITAVNSERKPGAPPADAVMIAAWEGFIEELEEAKPPAAMREYHQEWLDMQREDLGNLRAGTPTYYDPLDHAPDVSQELEERLQAAAARLPECRGPEETPRAEPTPASAIDYDNPAKYLQPGSQSMLTGANASVVKAELGALSPDLAGAGAIAAWIRTSFRTEPTGGTTIGKTDVNTLVESRVLTGCHDGALILSSILRLYGIPAVMVDTAGIQWAEDFRAGRARGFTGHVFVEAHIEGDWLLIECGSASYTADYDPGNPVIAVPVMPDPKGYYALFKGVDPAGYGATSGEVLQERMAEFTQQLPGLTLQYPSYTWQPLPSR